MTTSPGPANDHWRRMAGAWHQMGPPLRPAPADTAAAARALEGVGQQTLARRGLVLGVTPELWSLPWPDGFQVLAVDHTAGMVEEVWPGPRGTAWLGDWRSLPLRDASIAVAVCDGGFHTTPWPDGWRSMVAELGRVVAAGGRCVVRFFVPPEQAEPVDAVLADLADGRVPDLNVLKLRLWLALHVDAGSPVALHDVWAAVAAAVPDLDGLAARLGWPAEHVATFTSYRDSPGCYWFATEDEVRHVFCADPGGFSKVEVVRPDHPFGSLCPTVVVRRDG